MKFSVVVVAVFLLSICGGIAANPSNNIFSKREFYDFMSLFEGGDAEETTVKPTLKPLKSTNLDTCGNFAAVTDKLRFAGFIVLKLVDGVKCLACKHRIDRELYGQDTRIEYGVDCSLFEPFSVKLWEIGTSIRYALNILEKMLCNN